MKSLYNDHRKIDLRFLASKTYWTLSLSLHRSSSVSLFLQRVRRRKRRGTEQKDQKKQRRESNGVRGARRGRTSKGEEATTGDSRMRANSRLTCIQRSESPRASLLLLLCFTFSHLFRPPRSPPNVGMKSRPCCQFFLLLFSLSCVSFFYLLFTPRSL